MLMLIAPAGDVVFILVNKENRDKRCEGRREMEEQKGLVCRGQGGFGLSEVLRVWRPDVR